MGTEDRNHPTPFSSSGPVAGSPFRPAASNGIPFRPPPVNDNSLVRQPPPMSSLAPPNAPNQFPSNGPPPTSSFAPPNANQFPTNGPSPMSSFAPPNAGFQTPNQFPTNGPSPVSSFAPPNAGFQTPNQFPTNGPPPPRALFNGPPPPNRPPGGPVPFVSQPMQPLVPMGMPPVQNVQPNSPPIGPPPVNGGGPFQPPFGPPPGPFLTQQRGYAPGPPPVTQPGPQFSNQMQNHGVGPPVGSNGLDEDFNSLSLGALPGSYDAVPDSGSLPRPLEGDVEPKSLAKIYPMNCDSRYIRLTTSGLPNSQSLASRWHLPLGAVVSPLAEAPPGEEVPVVNFASTGIQRCRRCRTYVNPYVTFTDNGRKWRCNICSLLNDVPSDYYAQVDATGRRIDLDQRPELTKGSVEFIAPAEYMVRPPMPPLYFFFIDVSISAVKSGMLEVTSQTIKSCLDSLPGYPRTHIGFITYDSTIHFYNMKSSLQQPQMMVVSDLNDIFVPLPDDLLVNLSESRDVVEAFLDSLPSMFQESVNVESAFGPALQAAVMVMSRIGGKLLIFQNSLPSLGVGGLKLRVDDLKAYGTDKEHALRLPEDPFYKQMAAELTKCQISVNIYAFSDKYTDIASLGTLAKYTGGQVCYYPNFQSSIHGDKLRHELTRDLTRETAWEGVMRIRCGRGVRFTSYHGNFMLRSTDLVSLPSTDCDKAYVAQLSLEETLLTMQTVYFQVALLYTSSNGERRIRVHTAAAPVVADLGEMYRLADTGAIVSVLSRLAIEKTLSSKLEDARGAIQLRIVKALREYRNLYAVQHRLSGRMIYPESLKFLSMYGLALCKSMPLRGGYADVQLDERCAAGYTMMVLPVKRLMKLLYPDLVRIDESLVKTGEVDISKRLPLTAESLDSGGLYVFDDGFRFVIWFGRSISPDIGRNLLGEDFAADFSKVTLTPRGNDMSRKLMKILNKLREGDPSYFQLCHLVRQGEQPREGFFLLTNLVEDKTGGANGYADWMMQIHRQVQTKA